MFFHLVVAAHIFTCAVQKMIFSELVRDFAAGAFNVLYEYQLHLRNTIKSLIRKQMMLLIVR